MFCSPSFPFRFSSAILPHHFVSLPFGLLSALFLFHPTFLTLFLIYCFLSPLFSLLRLTFSPTSVSLRLPLPLLCSSVSCSLLCCLYRLFANFSSFLLAFHSVILSATSHLFIHNISFFLSEFFCDWFVLHPSAFSQLYITLINDPFSSSFSLVPARSVWCPGFLWLPLASFALFLGSFALLIHLQVVTIIVTTIVTAL